jgi:sugar phosphate isomerase/epimerase
MTRRDFVAALSAAALAGRLPALPRGARRLPRIGLQLYTVRKAMLLRTWQTTLAEIAAIGYREVEFAGYFGQQPAAIRGALDRFGLTAPAGHFEKKDLLASSSAPYDAAAALGHEWIIVAWIPPGERRTMDGWKRIADDLNRIGARARQAGLRFAYHNQDADFVVTQGKIPYDALLAATDRNLVELEIDLYWAMKGGQDPAAYISRTGPRTRLVHVKDSAGPPAHRMVDVGHGSMDWKGLLSTAWRAGIRHYFVEHDDPADPIAFARSSFAYLSQLDF